MASESELVTRFLEGVGALPAYDLMGAPVVKVADLAKLSDDFAAGVHLGEPREDVLRDALDREPTLAEVREYDLDGGEGTNFNTLQWRLDLVRAALASESGTAEAPSLDAAWRAAEAALPDGWKGPWVGPHFEGGYWSSVDRDGISPDEEILQTIEARGPTPAAALLALAARLASREPTDG